MPKSRIATRPLAALCGVALAAPALLAASGCGSSTRSSSPSGSAAAVAGPISISNAASKTTAERGAHISINGAVTAPGASTPINLSGSGVTNFATHEGTIGLTVSGLPAQAQTAIGGSSLALNEVLKGSAIYIGSPLFAGRLPSGAKWLKINTTQVAQGLGLDPSSLTSGGAEPGQYLQDLRAAGGTVKVIGHEQVRGVETTRYAASIDLVKAAELLSAHGKSAIARGLASQLAAKLGFSKIPIEAWVDGKGLVRKVAVHISSHGVGATIQAEFFDFGPIPPVNAPSPGEVFEVSSSTLKSLTGTA
jgi:hypothetical protein